MYCNSDSIKSFLVYLFHFSRLIHTYFANGLKFYIARAARLGKCVYHHPTASKNLYSNPVHDERKKTTGTLGQISYTSLLFSWSRELQLSNGTDWLSSSSEPLPCNVAFPSWLWGGEVSSNPCILWHRQSTPLYGWAITSVPSVQTVVSSSGSLWCSTESCSHSSNSFCIKLAHSSP